MTGLRSIRVGTRLAAGFASVTIAFVGLIFATGILAKADWQHLDSLHLDLRHKVDTINSIQAKQLLLISTIRNASLQQESSFVNKDIELYNKLVSEILISERQLLASQPNNSQTRILGEIAKVRSEAEVVAKQAADLTLSYSGDLAAKLLTTSFAEQDVKWRKLLDDLRASYSEVAQQRIVESREASDRLVLLSLVSVGVICAFAWFFSRWLTKSVVKPLEKTVSLATSFASGDLTARIQVEGRDELSELQTALGVMGLRLSSLVQKVRTSSDEVQDVSQQVADQSGALSARTAEQAASLEQTAAAMEQITSTVQENAASTSTATGQAKEALHSVSNGERVIGEVIQAIREIAEGSSRMSDVTGVVNSLAFQINILSLNAAVEAARAGEHGRGFAVVASEVRSLAQRSASAAKEIGALISQSTERVATGERKAAAAVEAMHNITERVSSVQALLENVSCALFEQSTGVTEVGVSVSKLDQMTQENAALVDRGANVASNLVHQAELLARSVAEFQTSPA